MGTTQRHTAAGGIDADQLFRLPWSMSDNAMTWMEPTRKCNLSCDACFVANDARGEKPIEQIRQELDDVLRLRRCDAVLIAGGEPLTHPKIVEIVALVRDQNIKPVLITNGVGLEPPLLRELKRAGLHNVTFHVDSHQSRPGWLGKSEAELNQLREHFADLLQAEGGLGCAFNTTIFPDTLDAVPSIVSWAVSRPRKVHVLTLICVRMIPSDDRYSHQVAGREVDLSKTPYVADEHYVNLTTEQMYAKIRETLPSFDFCGFLGGTVHARALKWAIGTHFCSDRESYGCLGARSMELAQNASHAFRGSYLAYTSPRENRRGRLAMLALAPIDPRVRRALRRYLAVGLRRPLKFWCRVHLQSINVVQPPDVLPNGQRDMCDGCPNGTLWDHRMVSACQIEEYRMFGGPVSFVPRDA